MSLRGNANLSSPCQVLRPSTINTDGGSGLKQDSPQLSTINYKYNIVLGNLTKAYA
jgi:hypothetical protein